MSLTAAEITICNQSLDRIGSANITFLLQGTNEALKCITHYSQTRDALLRSFEWNFASTRVELVELNTLNLDSVPVPNTWVIGDVITGLTSGSTATIISVVSDLEYLIAYLSDDFEDAEKLTNADVEIVYYEGVELTWEGEIVFWWETSDDEVQCGTGYPLVAESVPDFEWDKQYVLPTDFLRLKFVYECDGTTALDDRFAIEGNRLLTNETTASIKYIKKVTDPDDFDPLFTEVLVLQLALKLLHPLTGAGSPAMNLKQGLLMESREAMARARAICRTETNVAGRKDWSLARFSSGKV